MRTLILLAVFVLSLSFVSARRRRDAENCKAGDVWATNRIKFECSDGYGIPVACLPSGKVGQDELLPGQNYSSSAFKFSCTQRGPWEVAYEITGCILPNKTEFAIGESVGIGNLGVYNCVKTVTNAVSRKYKPGCYFVDRLYTPGESWTSGNTEVTCYSANKLYESKASGCIVESNVRELGLNVISLGAYTIVNGDIFKCQANGQVAWQADLVKATEAEYYSWIKVNLGDEEEFAGGNNGTGFNNEMGSPDQAIAVVPPTGTTGLQLGGTNESAPQTSNSSCCLRNLVPLYRLYSPSSRDYFYTTSAEEALKSTNYRYVYEGISGLVANKSDDCLCNPAGFAPVYRLFKAGCNSDYLYTANDQEAANASTNGYVNEGVAYYCPATNGQCGATKPFLRYIKNANHYYTTDAGEGASNGQQEGVLCYLWPTTWSENVCPADQCGEGTPVTLAQEINDNSAMLRMDEKA